LTGAQDPFRYFRVEARELLAELSRGVLRLEKATDQTLVAKLLRLAHTLKGAARVVKQGGIAERAHAIEETLAPLRTSEAVIARGKLEALLGLIDAIAADVKALDPRPSPQEPAGEPRVARADIGELDALLDGLSETSVQVRLLRRIADDAARMQHLAELLQDQLLRGAEDSLAWARARALVQDVRDSAATFEQRLGGGLDLVERELGDVRSAAERLRLAPAAGLFSVLERVARDAAGATGRTISFTTSGGEHRLDSGVLSEVQNALVQLVRNAVAHGIEPPVDRERVGKSPVGLVTVGVARRGSRMVFGCADDGRGFDVEAVRRAASRRGIAVPPVAAMGDAELLALLLKGGVTTSADVTEVSGRGIGLDVVREAASRVGGEVHLVNRPGLGASVELTVPISLSSIDALLVEMGGTTAAIPLEAVKAATRVQANAIVRSSSGEAVVTGGEVIPMMSLARAFGDVRPTRDRQSSMVVVEAGGARAAIQVDRVIGTANIVARPLPKSVRADPMVLGAALDAEGHPRPVLEAGGLVSAAVRGHASAPQKGEDQSASVLVIDDSLTTRRLEQSILESAGYNVELATSAEDGLAKARATHYSLFLVDVEMPGMDGFAFIEETRKDPLLRDIPSILVTSRSSPEDRRRGEQAGARGFIAKGEFDQRELLDLIRKLSS
jgi:two-component system, chemotaxis family, sensor kinase CheA